MKSLELALKKQSVVYIARDIERALGIPEPYRNYHIITNATGFAKQAKERLTEGRKDRLVLIENDRLFDTHELLEHPTTLDFLKKLDNPAVLVFKNTVVIEEACQKLGVRLLNPPANLSQKIEEKISQLAWLGDLKKFLPPHFVAPLKELHWSTASGKIIQFNRAHTGGGTFFMEREEDLLDLQRRFPDRPVRITDFIDGPMFTNNNIVWGRNILQGNINYQITGLAPFTDRRFATIGNDWALPHRLLDERLKENYTTIARQVGEKLVNDGWKGLFGIDVVLDQKNERLYLIEINARQPASTTYESQLQILQQKIDHASNESITTFEAHLASLLQLPYSSEALIKIDEGAQIVQRVLEKRGLTIEKQELEIFEQAGFKTIVYPNTKPGEDLIRIQSPRGTMQEHGLFNDIGDFIADEILPRPQSLQTIELGFRPDKQKLWALEKATAHLPLAEFDWELTLPLLKKEGTHERNLSPQAVLDNPEQETAHFKRIVEADLSFPIFVIRQNDRWRILDGLHRLCKAHVEGRTEIPVKIITEADIPLIRKQFN